MSVLSRDPLARSRADADLAEWVSAQVGRRFSGWQIERWRQAGLIEPADRTYPGRGSTAHYSDEQRAQVVDVARLVGRYRDLDNVARVLFVRHLYVREDRLRSGLCRAFDEVAKWIGPTQADADLDCLYDKAEKVGEYSRRTKLGKLIGRRLRGRGSPASVLAVDVYFELMHVLSVGSATSQSGLTRVLESTGLIGLISGQLAGMGPIAPGGRSELERHLRSSTLGRIRELLDTSTVAELEQSRDLLQLLLPFLKDFACLITIWFPDSSAFGLAALNAFDLDDELTLSTGVGIGLLLLGPASTDEGQELLAQARRSGRHFRRLAEFASTLSPAALAAIRASDPAAFAALPRVEQLQIRQGWAAIELADSHDSISEADLGRPPDQLGGVATPE